MAEGSWTNVQITLPSGERIKKLQYAIDVFGRGSHEGFFTFESLEQAVMPEEKILAFIKGAARQEILDPITDHRAVAYSKNGVLLLYDTFGTCEETD